jgi:hypothetical protein
LTEPASASRYRWEIEEVGRCLRAGLPESPMVPLDLTLAVMQVLDQAMADAKGKAPT